MNKDQWNEMNQWGTDPCNDRVVSDLRREVRVMRRVLQSLRKRGPWIDVYSESGPPIVVCRFCQRQQHEGHLRWCDWPAIERATAGE